jgi:hypothetical protein
MREKKSEGRRAGACPPSLFAFDFCTPGCRRCLDTLAFLRARVLFDGLITDNFCGHRPAALKLCPEENRNPALKIKK